MRNVTTTLTGDTLDRANFYADIVAGFIAADSGSGSTIMFPYTPRTGGDTVERECEPIEVVGTPGTSTHGFKGMTDNGPRTFNFHLMGA